jgi:hypothetical protein
VASATDQQAIFEALQARYGKRIAQAFIDAMQDLRKGVDLQRLIKAISDGDIHAAEAALHLDEAALSKLRSAIGDTFNASGEITVGTLPKLADAAGTKFLIRFNPGNPRAEEWLRTESSNLVTRILEDQRTALREALAAGMKAGDNPRTTALDIIGRIDAATGRRTGGIIGLSGPQADYLESAAAELASTDPALLEHYLTRTLRDKRYDAAVRRAIMTGEPIPAQTQESALISYSNRLLKLRGDTIAMHESFAAMNAAREEAFKQVVDKGAVAANAVRKTWRHFPNLHPRVQHIEMDGISVGLGQRFLMPDGSLMLYPHDPFAPIDQTAGCHCQVDYRIDFLANIR